MYNKKGTFKKVILKVWLIFTCILNLKMITNCKSKFKTYEYFYKTIILTCQLKKPINHDDRNINELQQ